MKTLLSWSSGKDSAWSLKVLRETPGIELCGLFTTLNEVSDRVAMHAVRREILEAQAHAAALPLTTIRIPFPCPNDVYAERMGGFVADAKREGIDAMAFGDLFLTDIRSYRERMLAGTGIDPLFPIWGENTDQLARTMIAAGLQAYVTCVDPKRLDACFAGRIFDRDFLVDLPPRVDPCGENGEFHTLVVDGPMFRHPVRVRPGDVVARDGFVFADFRSDIAPAQCGEEKLLSAAPGEQKGSETTPGQSAS